MGRPPTRQKALRDGFYLEIRNRKAKSGIKIRRDTEENMLNALKEYEKTKDVIVLGEFKKGKPVKKTDSGKKG